MNDSLTKTNAQLLFKKSFDEFLNGNFNYKTAFLNSLKIRDAIKKFSLNTMTIKNIRAIR